MGSRFAVPGGCDWEGLACWGKRVFVVVVVVVAVFVVVVVVVVAAAERKGLVLGVESERYHPLLLLLLLRSLLLRCSLHSHWHQHLDQHHQRCRWWRQWGRQDCTRNSQQPSGEQDESPACTPDRYLERGGEKLKDR